MRRVPLGQVRKIVQGQQTQVFMKNKGNNIAKKLEKMSMSLIYGHRQEDRTLDVMCQTEETFNLWFFALKYVTEQIRSRNHGRSRDLDRPSTTSTPTKSSGKQIQGFVDQNLGFPVSGAIPGDCYIWGATPEHSSSLKQAGLELITVSSPHLVPSSQKLDIIQVACGPSHFMAVTRSGNLYGWGCGDDGRLGMKSLQHERTPTTVPELYGIVSVACGYSNSAAITMEGALYTWGCGLTGQLGHGNLVTQYSPKRLISGINDVKIRSISCGPFHSAAVSECGSIYTWGDGFGGKLGHGNEEALFSPKRIENLSEVQQVACGWWHTAAVVKVDGGEYTELSRIALFTWGGHCSWNGDSNKGCLGNGAKTGEWFPQLVEGALEKKQVHAVACGLNLTVVLSKDGAVYQMGTTAAEDAHVPWEGATVPTRVEGPLRRIYADRVACGTQHVVVVASTQSRASMDKKSQVFSWGNGKRGQLGLGTHKDHTTPQFVEDLGSRKVQHVCCGGDYTLIVCSHDHKVAAPNATEMLVASANSELAPFSTPPRRSSHHPVGSGQVINASQLRLPLKRSALNHREGIASLDHISLGSSTSIRKIKSEMLGGSRNRAGSTPLSDAPSEQCTPAGDDRRSMSSYPGAPRTSTPTSIADSHEGIKHGSLPELLSQSQPPVARPTFEPLRPGEAESIASDPGDQGDESSSDDDASVANTEGQFTHDAYSEEDSTAHRSAPSFSEKSTEPDPQPLSKNLPDSFRMPTLPFPPTADIVSTTSARSLSHSTASAARLRTRQRGLERRLGITDTWASDRLISKQASAPENADLLTSCCFPSQYVIREEGIQTARDCQDKSDSKDGSSTHRHRRTNSEQQIYLNSLRESLKNVEDSKTKLLNYGKLLESVEERLHLIAARQKNELSGTESEVSHLLKLLDADDKDNSASFFEVENVEKTFKIVKQLSEVLSSVPQDNGPPSVDHLRTRVGKLEQVLHGIRELVIELMQTLGIDEEDFHESNGLNPQLQPMERVSSQTESTSNSQPVTTTVEMAHHPSSQIWMEKVDPGVSIVFQSTENGKTKIKKIRFAKRMFAWDAAQRWWEENHERLVRDYQLEPGFDPLSNSASES